MILSILSISSRTNRDVFITDKLIEMSRVASERGVGRVELKSRETRNDPKEG